MTVVRRAREAEPTGTREITVKLRDTDGDDECMHATCARRALPGRTWARYCDVHELHARPLDGVDSLGYEIYRRTQRGEM